MTIFDSLPYLLTQTKDIYGEYSLFIALRDVQLAKEANCFDGITHNNGNHTFFAIPYEVDFWESRPLHEGFAGQSAEISESFSTTVAALLDIESTDIQLQKKDDELLFSFQICDSQQTQTSILCAVYKEILGFLKKQPTFYIENILFPMASAGKFDVLVKNGDDCVDLIMYNLFGGECGRIEGIWTADRMKRSAVGEKEWNDHSDSLTSSRSSSITDAFSDFVLHPETASIIRSCLQEMNFNTSTLEPDESLVSFGLDSMECVELEQRISQRIGKQLSVGIVDKDTTLANLSTFLFGYLEIGKEEREIDELGEEWIPTVKPSRWQKRIILADSLEPKLKAQFNEAVAFRFLDKNLLESVKRALLTLVISNPNLRAVFEYEKKSFLSGTECYVLPSHLPVDCFHHHGLNIQDTIPMAWNLDGSVICVHFHHVVVDGYSLQLLMKQFKRILGGEDVAVDMRPFNPAGEAENSKSDDVVDDPQPLPTDCPLNQSRKRIARVFRQTFPEGFAKFMRQLRSRWRMTDFELLFAAFALVMKRRTGQDEFSLGTAMSVRGVKEMNTVDCLVSVIPVSVAIQEEDTVRQFVETIATRLKDEKEKIWTSETGPIQILLVMDKIDPVDIPGIQFLEIAPAICKYEQTWYFRKIGADYEIVVEYCSDLFLEESIRATIDAVLLAVKIMTEADGDSGLSRIDLSKRQQPPVGQRVDFPKTTIDKMIEVTSYPNFKWSFGKMELSQKDLLSEVSTIAWTWEQLYIQHYGEVPTADRQVVIFLPRGLDLGISSLAAWKLGMSIVPISRDWPVKRIQEMTAVFHNSLLITDQQELLQQMNKDGIACLHPTANKVRRKTAKSWNRMSSVSLGYITCTSGSTGVPKAVCSSIRGLSNLAMNYVRHFSLHHRSRIYQVVNYAFDIFFADLCKSLATGAQLVFAEESLPNWNELKSCTNAYIMPAILSSLPADMMGTLTSLETLQFGGEKIQPATLVKLLMTGVYLFQEFGLTEQCVYSTVLRLKQGTDSSFLGRSYHNIQLNVRNSNGKRHTSSGGWGELYVKGFVARGYHGLGDKNKERFKNGEFATKDRVAYFTFGIKFVGRMDLQVKILGRRIELGEIEVVLCRYPGVDESVVAVVDDRIYAYIKGNIDVSELIENVSDNLPQYMIPEEIFIVDKFPLNANGKIDKAKLTKPQKEKKPSRAKLPGNETELTICKAMKKILQVPIAVDECFFVKGGNSVKAMLVIQLLKENGLHIGIKGFFEARTAEKIALTIESAQRPDDHATTTSKTNSSLKKENHLEGSPGESRLIPLSHVQRRLWFVQKLHPENDAYTLKFTIEFDQGIDVARLQKALKDIIRQNPILKSEIVEIEGTPYLKINREIGNEGMLKTTFEEDRLILQANHLAIDGRSLAILAEQLEQAYRGEDLGAPQVLLPARNDETNLNFWRNYLENVEIHSYPPRHPVPDASNKAGRIAVFLPQKLSSQIISQKEKIFAVLLHSVVHTMRKVFDEEDIIIGTTVANRTVDDYNAVGMFANTLPMRFKGEITLQNVEEQIVFILEHQNSNLEEIQKMVGGELIKCVVNYQNTSSTIFGHPFTRCHLEPSEHCQFPLSWIFSDNEEQVEMTLEYDRSLFTEDDATLFVEWFLKELSGRRREAVPKEYKVDTPKTSIPRIFFDQADRSKKNITFESNQCKMTYEEAMSKSLKIADSIEQNVLVLLGRIPRVDDIVAIHLEEGLLLHLAINAVLLLGCAYTVVSFPAPEERKKAILQEANPIYVINEKDLKSSPKTSTALRRYLKLQPDDLMYVMFTSGSTGKPKGVPVAHFGVANMLSHATILYHINSRGRVLQFTKSHFDASISNTFGPLVNGATLCLLEKEKEATEAVSAHLPLTLLHMTPTVLNYSAQDETILKDVESLSIGGESPSPATVHRLLSEGRRLVQLYGPTEATCYQTSTVLRNSDLVNCVGKAVPNLFFGVCTWIGTMTGQEDVGQFFCGGRQLSRGYLNDVAMTRNSFISNPYRSSEDRILNRNSRLYLTGDRVHIDKQRRMHFVGRKDQQVKISGHRVEVGEVEAALGQLEGVQSVAVVTKEDRVGRSHLVAYYTGRQADHIPFLAKRLPAYMIPVKVIHLEKMPITGNAKIDKRALSQRSIKEIEEGEHSKLEEDLLKIYQEVLATDDLTADSNFFHHGGHSLLAVKLASRLEKKFSVAVPIATIWIENTPRKLAKFIEGASTVCPALNKRQFEYQPSLLQLPLLRLMRHRVFQEIYTNVVKIRLLKKISREKIEDAFKELTRRHISLRTRYHRRGKNIESEIIPEEEFHKIFHEPMDVFKAFPINVLIDEEEVTLTTSHIAVDGHSMQVIVDEIKHLLDGDTLEGEDNPMKFNIYVERLFEENKNKVLGYWKQKVADWKPTGLVSDYPRKIPQNYESETVTRKIQCLPNVLRRLAVNHGVTPFSVLLAALGVAMRPLLHDPKSPLSIVFPVNMRSEQFSHTITMGVNTSVVLLPDGDEPETFQEVGKRVMESIGHPILLEELSKLLGKDKRLYEVMVTFDDYTTHRTDYFEIVRQPEKYSKCEISFFTGSSSEEIIVDYVKELFREETIQEILDRVEDILIKWSLESDLPDGFLLTMSQKQMFFSSFTGHNRVLPFIIKKTPAVDDRHLQRVLNLLAQKYPVFRTVFFLSETGEPLQRVLSITESYRLIRKGRYMKNCPPSSIKMNENLIDVIVDNNLVVLWLHHITTDAWSTRILEQELDQLLAKDITEVGPLKYTIKDCLDSTDKAPPDDYVLPLAKGETLFEKIGDNKAIWRKVFFISKSQENIFTRIVSALVASLNVRNSINIGFPFANRTPKTSKLVGYFLNNLVINVEKRNLAKITSEKMNVMAWNVPYMQLVDAVRQAGAKDDPPFQIYLNCRYDLESSTPDDRELLDILPLSCEFPIEIDVDSYPNEEKITIRALAAYLTEKQFEELSKNMQRSLAGKKDDNMLDVILKVASGLLKKNIKKEDNFFRLGGTSLQAIELAEVLEDILGKEVDMEHIYGAKDFGELARKMDAHSPTAQDVNLEKDNKKQASSTPVIFGRKSDIPSVAIPRIFQYLSLTKKPVFVLPNYQNFSYCSVIEKAQKIAFSISQEYLQLCGKPLQSDDIIPVIGKKTVDTWINCFAVQLAGAAYLPISSATPLSRIEETLLQAQIVAYVGDDLGLSVLILPLSTNNKKEMIIRNRETDMAYTICTSGTTGAPKIVCIEHRSVINTMIAAVQDLRLTSQDVIYQFTNFCYDNSVLEVFSALASSCQIFLDPAPFTPRRFSKQISIHKITHCLLFPGLISQFKEDAFNSLRQLKYWVTGAEKLWESLLTRATGLGINVIQNYGPTETTCYALTRHMRPGDVAANLGNPIQNARVKIIGGELWIAGRGRMRGYLNRMDSFTVDEDGIWYKTGDLVRLAEDNCIIFLGRKDNQVKIRGHRVELDEIGESLMLMEGMDQCRVRWQDPLLIAYCVTLTLSEEKIKLYAEQNLPLYMRPNEIHILEELPLTENSKVDFKRLGQSPKHQECSVLTGICEKILARNLDRSRPLIDQGGTTLFAIRIKREIEKATRMAVDIGKLLVSPLETVDLEPMKPSRMKQAWQMVLGHDDINEHSHFFLCGGTSLHILRLKVELAKLGLNVTVQNLLSRLKLGDMEKLDIPRVVVSLSKSNRPKRMIVLVHPLYGGAAPYIHLTSLFEDESTQFLAIEHPNTFSFATERETFFESLTSLTAEYARQLDEYLEGDVILCGVSIGGTMAVEIARKLKIRPIAVIAVDTLANPDLETYSFKKHKEKLLVECPFADNAVVANSWDLLQMLKRHKWNRIDFPLTLLSVDGTDLGWNRYCSQLTVLPIAGPHSALLRPPAVSQIADIIRSFF